jgi:hypothetical protein
MAQNLCLTWFRLCADDHIDTASTGKVRTRLHHHTLRTAIRSLFGIHPAEIDGVNWMHAPGPMAHRILNLPHTKPISGCSLYSVTFSEHDAPITDASLKPNIGLQHLHTCPYRTPERRSKQHHLPCVLAANTPTLCHKSRALSKLLQRMPLASDLSTTAPLNLCTEALHASATPTKS